MVATADSIFCDHCGGATVEDEHHLLFECPRYADLRLLFPAVFANDCIGSFADLVKFDKKESDWPKVVRGCCKFLALTGKIYKQ
jgi:hypothetical protein